MSSFNFSIRKKIVLNAFRESTSTMATTGTVVTLSDSIRYNKKIQVDRLKREKLPIPTEFEGGQTTYLNCPDI